MAISGRTLLDLPCFIMSVFGIHPFSRGRISLWCAFLLVFQFAVFMTGIIALADFRNVDADIWVTAAAASQVPALPDFTKFIVAILKTILNEGVTKAVVLLTQKQKFFKIGEMLRNFQLRRERTVKFNAEQEQKLERFAIRCQRIYTFIVTSALIAFMTKPAVVRERITPSVAYYVCDVETTSCYALNYAAQCWAAIYAIYIMISVDCLFWSLLYYAYLELGHVKDTLLHLKINKQRYGDDPEVLQQISFLVEHHDQALSYVRSINDAYSGLMVYQCICTFFIVGMSQFCITLNGFPPSGHVMVTYTPYYVAGLCQMFTYCMAGDIITDQAASIGAAAYHSRWWIKHQPKLGKALCLIIQRSQRTLKVTVGGLWVLNLETYCSIIKTTMSVLAFVKTVYDN